MCEFLREKKDNTFILKGRKIEGGKDLQFQAQEAV